MRVQSGINLGLNTMALWASWFLTIVLTKLLLLEFCDQMGTGIFKAGLSGALKEQESTLTKNPPPKFNS